MRPHSHPADLILLGEDQDRGARFELEAADLDLHVFLIGASGSGKTTTLTRLAAGWLHLGHAVVIVDCKGGDLKEMASDLAERHRLPFFLVDPDDPHHPDSLGYDPCSGDASSITNKLIGAFNYEGAAEIYKLVAMRTVPLVVRAMQAAGDRVTLDTLATTLDGRLAELASRAGEPYADSLFWLDERKGAVAEGLTGLAMRFGALLEGKFGELFQRDDPLDWDEVLGQPSVTYLSLRATASGEDVDLMGRVIAQDLKQAAARRFQRLSRREPLVPALVIFDEFAALREAAQIVDLLLQARQARMPTIVSTQYLPETVPIREACFGAGLLIVHRVTASAAEEIASQFGTHRENESTMQLDFLTGETQKGSLRRVDVFNVHPNELREMPRGVAAVRAVPSRRQAVVQVYRDEDEDRRDQ